MATFRLQSVLDLRQQLEDQARQLLAATLQRQRSIREQRDRHAANLDRLTCELQQRENEGCTITDLQLYRARIDFERDQMTLLELQLIQVEQEVAQRQDAVLAARTDREAMETLKARHLADERQRQKQDEIRLLDEVGARGRTPS